jgi:hypothetical protein
MSTKITRAPSRDRHKLLAWHDVDCLVANQTKWHGIRGHEKRSRHRSWRDANPGSTFPAPSLKRPVLEVRFEELASRWEADTAFESIVTRKAMDPSYQRIIGMGAPVVPLILRRMQQKPRQWFWALTAITGEDPALGQTSIASASEAWLSWGRERGFVA